MKIKNSKLKIKNSLNPGEKRGSFGIGEILKEIRCSKCNKLFGKEDIKKGVLEIKCHRCGNLERFHFRKVERMYNKGPSPP